MEFLHDLRTRQGLGPAAALLPPRHDDDNRDHDWHHLPEVHPSRHHHRQARSKQIHSRTPERLAGVQVVITMAKSYDLKPAPLNDEKAYAAGGASVVNRRQFLRYGFNATTGVLAASVGVAPEAISLAPRVREAEKEADRHRKIAE